MAKVKISYDPKLKSREYSGWKVNGKPVNYKYALRIKDKTGLYRTYLLNSDGSKTLMTKPEPDRKEMYKAIWKAENPSREGVKKNRYKKFDTRVKYDLSKPEQARLAKYSPNGNMHDVGAGINVENLLASPKKSDNLLAEKAAKEGLTKLEVDSLINARIDENLAAANEALSWKTNFVDTISPLIKMGLMDVRYLVGNLGSFDKLLTAASKGNVGNENQPESMLYENSVKVNNSEGRDTRRQKFRNDNYFHYKLGGNLIQKLRKNKIIIGLS